MSCEQIFEKLSENPPNVSQETTRLLIKIAQNILKSPSNEKLRRLQKDNATVSNKILRVEGGRFCLNLMGFVENNECFTLPQSASLNKLRDIVDALEIWRDLDSSSNIKPRQNQTVESKQSDHGKELNQSQKTVQKSIQGVSSGVSSSHLDEDAAFSDLRNVKPLKLPPLIPMFTNPFLLRLESYFHDCLRYEDKALQERAKKLIPLIQLEEEAQKRLRCIQEHFKKNKLGDPNISIQETLLLELLRWFKEEFFAWVDSPDCQFCGGKCQSSHMSNDPKLLVYTTRVEMHKCLSCHRLTPFPRYNDLNILLETRRGRCGEWANTFTLFCRAMGWDTRFVVDEGDHVWTEVYSIAQKRWMHCDSCENVCDKPLMYETGWKKNITYVMAYSGEEVQDVTWRYTSNHKLVLSRRRQCPELQLVKAIAKLNRSRQAMLSKPRRDYLAKRCLVELAELLIEKKPSEEENRGRESGGSDWRLARGEIQEESANFTWRIGTAELQNNCSIRYSTAKDRYEYSTDGVSNKQVKGWNGGAFSHTNILKKEEKDWKQIYLARKEGSAEATIVWKFELEDQSKSLDRIEVSLPWTTYENGQVTARVCAGDVCMLIDPESKMISTSNFAGQKELSITVTLTGGKGNVAWQHTQLFRQPTSSEDFPFNVTFYFK